VLAPWANQAPWELTSSSEAIVRQLLSALAAEEFLIMDDIAVHRTATVEAGAMLKGPLILGANCFVAAGDKPEVALRHLLCDVVALHGCAPAGISIQFGDGVLDIVDQLGR
jgi:hypothetical protein